LGGQPVNEFESNKVRALLAYLAAEAGQPQSREILAALLWPETPNATALTYLRIALADSRKNLGDREADPPFLLVTWVVFR
jgi:DNA-binding SARP family transcriptional activator